MEVMERINNEHEDAPAEPEPNPPAGPSLPIETLRTILDFTLALLNSSVEVQQARICFSKVARAWYLVAHQEREYAVVGSNQAERLTRRLNDLLDEQRARGEQVRVTLRKLYLSTRNSVGAGKGKKLVNLLALVQNSVEELDLVAEQQLGNYEHALFTKPVNQLWKTMWKVHTLSVTIPSLEFTTSHLQPLLQGLPNLRSLRLDIPETNSPSAFNPRTLKYCPPGLTSLHLICNSPFAEDLFGLWAIETPANLSSLTLDLNIFGLDDITRLNLQFAANQFVEFNLTLRPTGSLTQSMVATNHYIGPRIAPLLGGMHKLQKLSLLHTVGCSAVELETLTKLPHLHSAKLNLRSLSRPDLPTFEKFLLDCSTIKEVSVVPAWVWYDLDFETLKGLAEGHGIDLRFVDSVDQIRPCSIFC